MYRFISIFISSLFISSSLIAGGPGTSKPKLVVGIVVDQMRYDYLTRYWDKFGEGGFKKLVNEGTNCSNVHYNYIPTYTGPGHASIFTGTVPSVHGIVGNDWFNRELNRMVYVTWDPSVKGAGSLNNNGNQSPSNLRVTTFSDELRIATNFKSKVIGISLKDRSAILPAGRSGNAAYWLDNATGHWISSSWYMNNLPAWMEKYNARNLSDSILHSPWNTLLPISEYTNSLVDLSEYEKPLAGEKLPVFPHHLDEGKTLNYELIKFCPGGNTMTVDVALMAMKEEELGKDDITDVLNVSFSPPDNVGHSFGPNSIEMEDTYIRLDKDLERMISEIENYCGKNNVLFFLTSDHGAPSVPKYLSDNKIAAGIFEINKVADSLKNFIAEKYGDRLLISAVYNNQVYFNHALLTKNNIQLNTISDDVVDFLFNTPGVDIVVTYKELMTREFSFGIKSMIQKGYNRKRSGDIAFTIDPGLLEHSIQGTDHGSGNVYDTHVPLLFYGKNIKPVHITRNIEITDITPTISQMLDIQPPNGCTGKPIEEVLH